jgi:hypothetical protein
MRAFDILPCLQASAGAAPLRWRRAGVAKGYITGLLYNSKTAKIIHRMIFTIL